MPACRITGSLRHLLGSGYRRSVRVQCRHRLVCSRHTRCPQRLLLGVLCVASCEVLVRPRLGLQIRGQACVLLRCEGQAWKTEADLLRRYRAVGIGNYALGVELLGYYRVPPYSVSCEEELRGAAWKHIAGI